MHQKKITFSAAKIHGNIFLSRILTSNIYALSLNPHKKKLRETVKLHLEKNLARKKVPDENELYYLLMSGRRKKF
jgi:hypothetical protein